MTRAAFVILLLASGTAQAASAPPSDAALLRPHYASQRGSVAYLREGPGYAYKVLWVYRHRGYPFQVIASFDIWRRVRDVDGIVGWMSAQMLTDNRTLLVTGKGRVQLHESDDSGSKLTGLAEPGAILNLKRCARDMCRGTANGIDGWIARDRVWGADDVFR